MKPAERTYRGRKTKWFYIDRYYAIIRTVWPEMRELQKKLLIEGRLSVKAFKYECDISRIGEFTWLQERIARAAKKANPIDNLNQINIYRLEQAIRQVDEWLVCTQDFLNLQISSPLEETEGYVYNKQYGISQEELLAVAENANGFEKVDNVLRD